MDTFIVEYTVRDKDGYAYETEEHSVCFASEKEAWDFFETLPAYIEKHFSKYYTLENRYPPKNVGIVYHYDREKLEIL